MPRDKSREWLDRLLAGEVMPVDGLKALPDECHEETLYLDYKSGKLLTDGETDRFGKRRDAAYVLRQYISAFANADGGLLVIGYKEAEKASAGKPAALGKWDDAKAPGGSTLREWATRCLTQMPQARSIPSETRVDGKSVLLVAVPRCRSLVPVVESGEPVYYLRMGDQTVRVPPYLVSDLMLGRRNEAQLDVKTAACVVVPAGEPAGPRNPAKAVLSVSVENTGIAFADDIRIGAVGWCPAGRNHEPAGGFLQQQVSGVLPAMDDLGLGAWELIHVPMDSVERTLRFDLRPFEARSLSLDGYPLLALAPGCQVCVQLALYVLARGQSPWWYEARFNYARGNETPAVTIVPAYDQRPSVSLAVTRRTS